MPTKTPKVTLGGAILTNAGPVSWTQTTGVAAPLQVFTLHKTEWPTIEANLGKFVSMEGAIEWERLFLVREVPTTMPHHRAVLVSDVRYLWARELVVRSMNIPRKTGDRRMSKGEIIELQFPIDSYKYAEASLNNGNRWRPQEAVESVLSELAYKCGHNWKIESMPFLNERELTVEGLDLADPGDAALGKVLMHIPHAEITVNSSGVAVVFDGTKLSASEEVMEGAGPATVAGGIDRIIDLNPIRPSSIHVYFAKEVELRFDSIVESDEATSSSQEPDAGDSNEPMTMENVLPLPDPVTVIDGKEYTMGSYVLVSEALRAWNDDLQSLSKPINPPTLNLENLRKHWWVLESLYLPLGNLTLSAGQSNWAARISLLRQHYRQTFRINHNWMMHIRDLIPYRVGILDPVTGARSPSPAWSQYCIEPTQKLHVLAKLADDDDLQFYWLNVDGYPGINGQLWSKAPSPAHVEVLDKDLGILHIAYQSDRYQNRSNIHPSMLRNNQDGKVVAPTRDLSKQLNLPLTKDSKMQGTAYGLPLASDFRVAILVTAMPFMPNHEGRFLRWDVNPDDVAPYLSDQFGVKDGRGPPWHIFIPPTLMTAWYAHQTTEAAGEGALRLFGFVDAPPGEDNDSAAGYSVMNSDAMIPAMANAAAVAQWAAFVSQREGTRAVHLTAGIEPVGAIESVRHSISPDGRLLTEISLPSSRRPSSALAFIPHETRPWILGQIPNIKP